MDDILHFHIGQRVRMDQRSEHFPGAEVFIVDSMPGEEYDYCVAANPISNATSECEWVKAEHIWPLSRTGEPVIAPTALPKPKVKLGRPRKHPESDEVSPPLPAFPRGRKAAGEPFEVGDPVVARDDTNFTMLPEVGYVTEVDDGMVGIARERGKAPDILVSRRFVRHA